MSLIQSLLILFFFTFIIVCSYFLSEIKTFPSSRDQHLYQMPTVSDIPTDTKQNCIFFYFENTQRGFLERWQVPFISIMFSTSHIFFMQLYVFESLFFMSYTFYEMLFKDSPSINCLGRVGSINNPHINISISLCSLLLSLIMRHMNTLSDQRA